jgi:hypothetical protein
MGRAFPAHSVFGTRRPFVPIHRHWAIAVLKPLLARMRTHVGPTTVATTGASHTTACITHASAATATRGVGLPGHQQNY